MYHPLDVHLPYLEMGGGIHQSNGEFGGFSRNIGSSFGLVVNGRLFWSAVQFARNLTAYVNSPRELCTCRFSDLVGADGGDFRFANYPYLCLVFGRCDTILRGMCELGD